MGAKIEVAVFDLAGTTVTDPGVVEAAVKTAASHQFRSDTFHEYRGGSKLDMLAALVGPDSAPQALRAFESELVRVIEDGLIQPLPHAESALRRVRQVGVRVCLSTGFSPVVREALLAALDWTNLVELTLSPDDNIRGRPWPDLILQAALTLRASDMANVAVVGDTANDIKAGRRAHAGIVAGVLTGAHDRATLEGADPTHLLAHVGEFADLVEEMMVGARSAS